MKWLNAIFSTSLDKIGIHDKLTKHFIYGFLISLVSTLYIHPYSGIAIAFFIGAIKQCIIFEYYGDYEWKCLNLILVGAVFGFLLGFTLVNADIILDKEFFFILNFPPAIFYKGTNPSLSSIA